MNYITEIKAFMDLVHVKSLSTGQIALWYALMYINNKCAWAEWFTVPNNTLELYTSLSRQGIIKCRNALKQCGVIDFKSNGTKAASYKLITMLDSVQASVQDGVSAKMTMPNSVQSSVQNSVQASVQASVQNSGTLNKLNETKLNKTKHSQESVECVSPVKLCEKAGDIDTLTAEIIELYNSICTKLVPVAVIIHASRSRAILNLWNVYPDITMFKKVFANANNSLFLTGGGKNKWVASIDWLLKQDNFVKIFEGVYNNSTSQSGGFGHGENSLDIDELDKFWDTVPKLK